MILRSRLEANIKYVVTTLYSSIKMGFLDKIDKLFRAATLSKRGFQQIVVDEAMVKDTQCLRSRNEVITLRAS